MQKIMIIEDDREISRLVSEFLQDNGYTTICLYEGLHISAALKENGADLILLDLMLPYRSGDLVLAEIRDRSSVPVIVVSARGTTQNKIDLLRLGADDYITKPFDMEELLARIESNLRRAQLQKETDRSLQFGGLVMDLGKNTVSLMGEELVLTAKEYGILEMLMTYPDKIFSKANLYESVWKEEYFCEDNALNVHISNLRNKLKMICPEEEYIDTVWGIGYRMHKG